MCEEVTRVSLHLSSTWTSLTMASSRLRRHNPRWSNRGTPPLSTCARISTHTSYRFPSPDGWQPNSIQTTINTLIPNETEPDSFFLHPAGQCFSPFSISCSSNTRRRLVRRWQVLYRTLFCKCFVLRVCVSDAETSVPF